MNALGNKGNGNKKPTGLGGLFNLAPPKPKAPIRRMTFEELREVQKKEKDA